MRPAKVLYIEDNDQNFYLVEYILKAKGYSVVRARDGREGLEMAEKGRPDLILLDIQLPIMDGHTSPGSCAACPRRNARPSSPYLLCHARGPEKAWPRVCDGYIENRVKRALRDQIGTWIEPYTGQGALTG